MTAKHIQEAWDKLRDKRDELAAQVEAMRAALDGAAEYTALLDDFTQEAIREALTLPNTSAAILRQRDARMLREAACVADQWGWARKPSQGGNALRNCANHIRSIADELEKQHG